MNPSTPALRDQVVLVSGAAGGIGAATARRLLDRGARVVLADRDAEALDAVVAGLGSGASGVVLDVTDPEACDRAVASVLRDHGRLDVVWANAGTSAFGPVETLPAEEWRQVVATNLVGAYNLLHAALPAVIEHRGYLAATASWAS
ncbi:MAG: family NAD(P)-dependent oxidoreductase, partial [Marmoricola sp.]|nr:family NAD(P)-dependent oxidoreductase [Marmoricola sp.]